MGLGSDYYQYYTTLPILYYYQYYYYDYYQYYTSAWVGETILPLLSVTSLNHV